jgi:uncharacterized protein YijF (DUF1287 family)
MTAPLVIAVLLRAQASATAADAEFVKQLVAGAVAQIGQVVRYDGSYRRIRRGPELEDMLFRYPVTGHFRYRPNETTRASAARRP